MIGWILVVTAVALIAAIGWAMMFWRWVDYRFMSRFATDMQVQRDEARAQRDKLNTENAKLYETAEKDAFLYRRMHDENTHLLAQNATLRQEMGERILALVEEIGTANVCIRTVEAERDSLRLQLAEALKPKTRTKKEKAQP